MPQEQAKVGTHIETADYEAAKVEWKGKSLKALQEERTRIDASLDADIPIIDEHGQDSPSEVVARVMKDSATLTVLAEYAQEAEDRQHDLDAAVAAHKNRTRPASPRKGIPQRGPQSHEERMRAHYGVEVGHLSGLVLPQIEAFAEKNHGGDASEIRSLQMSADGVMPTMLAIGTGDIVTPRPDSGEITSVYRRPMEVLDLFRMVAVPVDTSAYYYRKQTSTKTTAAARTEEAAFSVSDYDVGRTTEQIRSIGHIATVSNELLGDGGQELRDFFDYDLTEAVRDQIEVQLMNGNGASPNLAGLLGRTGIGEMDLSETSNLLDEPVKDVSKGITKLYSAGGVMATHLLAHPSFVDLLQVDENAAGGGFYLGDAGGEFMMRIWGARIVMCGTGLVNVATHVADTIHAQLGAWSRRYIRLAERAGISVQVGSNDDDFSKNRASIRAHARIGLAVPRSDAFLNLIRL